VNKLNSKRAIITGGASGIGLATVDEFLKEGAEVIVFDNNKDSLCSIEKERPGIKALVHVDVSNFSALMKAFETMNDLWNTVDILVNNAGISLRHNAFWDISVENWQKVIATNLNSVFYMSKLTLPYMKPGGVILNMSSVNALAGFSHYADYNASKAGIIALSKTMAIELAPKKIRVNALCPGAVMTPMQKAEYTEEMFEKVNQNIPLNRHADPSEIAKLFVFLASDEASFMTGHYYVIDGGEMARAIL